jgi:hypothetical protein
MSKKYSLEELAEIEEKQRKKGRLAFAVVILIFGIGGLLFTGTWYAREVCIMA